MSSIRLGIAPPSTTSPTPYAPRVGPEGERARPGHDRDDGDRGHPGGETRTTPGATTAVPRGRVGGEGLGAGEGVELLAQVGAHASAPTRSASSGARTRRRRRAWRDMDLTAPLEMPSSAAVRTSVRSSK